MSIEIETPVGRIVGGNPLEHRQKLDQKTRQPKMGSDGYPQQSTYFGLAIAKGQEANWWETSWGAQILAVAQADWPGGETGNPAFAWKITDGDSQIPNQAGRKPCDNEGYPGHWVLQCETGIPVRCYRDGQFEQHQILQPEAKEIKTGDYGRAYIHVRGNGAQPPAKPGIYVNPSLFALVQSGPVILTGNAPDPHTAFSQAPTMPAGALPDPGGAPTPATPGAPPAAATAAPPPPGAAAPTPPPGAPTPTPPASVPPVATPAGGAPGAGPAAMPPPTTVAPATDFLNPDERRIDTAGNAVTVAALKAAGWNDDQVKALPLAQ